MLVPFIVHIPLLLLISFYLNKRYISSPISYLFWPSLLLKLVAGIGIGLLYIYFYKQGGDTIIFQKFSSKLTIFAKDNFVYYLDILIKNDYSKLDTTFNEFLIQPRVLFTFKILSFLNIFTFSNYWINSLYLSLFSFWGLWILADKLNREFKITTTTLAISFFFLPSFVFWSSGVLKESIVVGIIALLIYLFLIISNNRSFRWYHILAFILLLYVGWQIKFYYIAVLLTCMLSYLGLIIIEGKFSFKSFTTKYLIILILFLVISVIGLSVIPSLNLNYLIEVMYISYKNMIAYSKSGTYFIYENLQPTFTSFIKNSPEALITGLFRPWIWETHNTLSLITAIENCIISLLFICFVYQKIKNRRLLICPAVFSLLIYIVVSATLMALISPNWGTLSRYKAGYLPFFVLLISQHNPLIDYFKIKFASLKQA